MSQAYKDALVATDSTFDVYISVGTGIDTTAADDLTGVSGTFLPMSNISQVTDAVYALTPGLATFEGDGIPTALSAGMIVPPLTPTHYPPEAGMWSDAISAADGTLGFVFTIQLSQAHTSAIRIYTDGPAVTEATAVFSDGSSSESVVMECSAGYMTVVEPRTYTSIQITVSKLEAPYRHLRIVEIEFGASAAISTSELRGEVTYIAENDPMEQSMPMYELDFEIINVEGDYDLDKPDSRLAEFAIGYPVNLSFTLNDADGNRYTVPCGRFVIGERSSSDTSVSITAFDGRWMLSNVYVEWTLSATQSIGKTLDDLLTDYGVPHIVDTDLYELMPDAEYRFSDESSILDDLLDIQQAYAIWFVPGRDGSISVTTDSPVGTYGTVPTAGIYSWPTPQQITRYNYVSVGYVTKDSNGVETTLYVEQDLRTDPSEARSVLQISGNGLIGTETRAQSILSRLVTAVYTEEAETEWIGDPAMDLADSVSTPGRWTQEVPRAYSVRYVECVFNGAFRQTIRGTRR